MHQNVSTSWKLTPSVRCVTLTSQHKIFMLQAVMWKKVSRQPIPSKVTSAKMCFSHSCSRHAIIGRENDGPSIVWACGSMNKDLVLLWWCCFYGYNLDMDVRKGHKRLSSLPTMSCYLSPACLMISVMIHFTHLFHKCMSSNAKPKLAKAMEKVAEYC